MPRTCFAPALAVAAIAAAACASPTQPGGGVQVRVGGTTFARGADGTAAVPYTVANTGTASVLLTGRCGDHLLPAVEQRRGGAWAPHSGGACLAIYPSSPVPLAGGGLRPDTAGVREPGEYRLVLATERATAASAAFTVR